LKSLKLLPPCHWPPWNQNRLAKPPSPKLLRARRGPLIQNPPCPKPQEEIGTPVI
jgi:hypothetical protein